MKVVVFGDTGGHSKQLFASLTNLGVDLTNYKIPSNLKIIHLGDLIHKGPSSENIISTVNLLIRNNPGQWVQVLGNHELQHLGGDVSLFWRCDCSEDLLDTLYDLWQDKLIVSAYGLENVEIPHLTLSARDTFDPVGTSWLFTHAGLTKNNWGRFAEASDSVIEVAARLNEMNKTMLDSSGMIMGYGMNPNVSHVWAIASKEVFHTWADTEMPFNQLHGHTAAFDWESEKWYFDPSNEGKVFRKSTKLNPETRASISKTLNGSVFVGLDPSFEKPEPSLKEQPYIVLNEVVF